MTLYMHFTARHLLAEIETLFVVSSIEGSVYSSSGRLEELAQVIA